MPQYKCDRCGWNSINKAHFKLHLQRKFICNPQSNVSINTMISKYFPELLVEKSEQKIYSLKETKNEIDSDFKQQFSCSFCNKKFDYKQSKCRHEKICQNDKLLDSIEDDKIDEAISDKEKIKLLIEKLNEEKKRVKDKEKLLSHYEEIINKTVINTTNNTTTNNNTTINFQMNAFGSENLSYISKSFLTQLLKIPYSSIPKLLEYIHFNKNYPENQNVKIINRKEKWAQKHNGTDWEFVPKTSLINEMISNGVNILEVHYEENGGKEELNEVKQERWEKFSGEIKEEKPTTVKRLVDDTECLLLNKLNKSKETTDDNSIKLEIQDELHDFESLEEADLEIQKNLETINNIN